MYSFFVIEELTANAAPPHQEMTRSVPNKAGLSKPRLPLTASSTAS